MVIVYWIFMAFNQQQMVIVHENSTTLSSKPPACQTADRGLLSGNPRGFHHPTDIWYGNGTRGVEMAVLKYRIYIDLPQLMVIS